MIERPERYVEQFCDAGADIVTCHVEADTEENIHLALKKIHAKGKKAGVVVKPKTPASAVLPFIGEVELILVMTVEPGFGGQKFMADMMPKVQQIRSYIDAMNPLCELEVDGGVDPDTCKICIGLRRQCAGGGFRGIQGREYSCPHPGPERVSLWSTFPHLWKN